MRSRNVMEPIYAKRDTVVLTVRSELAELLLIIESQLYLPRICLTDRIEDDRPNLRARVYQRFDVFDPLSPIKRGFLERI